MKSSWFFLFLCACTGDDVIYNAPEGGSGDATTDGTMMPPMDGGSEAGDAASDAPMRFLMTQTAGSTVELAAFDPSTGMVDGRLAYSGVQAVVFGTTAGPFLVQTENDVVLGLDPKSPWLGKSVWSVAMNDAFDGGEPWADPIQIVAVSPSKAYVLRYNRNRIAILDPSKPTDAGVPIGSVDLSSLLQGDDLDGHVDMDGAIYDPVRKRLYVALSNLDVHRVDPMGFFQICANTKSTLVAIDTTTDMLVNLGGSGPGGSVVLNGRGPQFGFLGGVQFDAAGDRVLVMSTGCQDKLPDGGASPMKGRVIEAVSLSSNTTQTLLDANAQEFPGQLLFLSPAKAVVQFGYGIYSTTYLWDPTQTTLGAPLSTTPEIFAYDGKNAIVGPRARTVDGGKEIDVIGVSITNPEAGAALLGKNPFTKAGDFYGNITTW